MRRQIEGLKETAQSFQDEVPDGVFLVRVLNVPVTGAVIYTVFRGRMVAEVVTVI